MITGVTHEQIRQVAETAKPYSVALPWWGEIVISEGAPHVKGAGQVFCPARLRPAGPMGFARARRSGRAVKGRPEAEREP
jgi:hypothetical protein